LISVILVLISLPYRNQDKSKWKSKQNPIFDALPCGGLMDHTFYRDIIPDPVWAGQDAPAEAVAGAINAGQGDYVSTYTKLI